MYDENWCIIEDVVPYRSSSSNFRLEQLLGLRRQTQGDLLFQSSARHRSKGNLHTDLFSHHNIQSPLRLLILLASLHPKPVLQLLPELVYFRPSTGVRLYGSRKLR
jgi:hypothetical protein